MRSKFLQPRRSQQPIKRLEVTDLKIEFVFFISTRQDGSGEKGFATLNLDFFFHVERERPGLSLRSEPALDTPLCPGK
jgi:hypothetical protein